MTLRIRKLSRPGLQLRLVGWFVGMATLGLLLQFLLLGGRLTGTLAKLPRYGGDVAQEVPSTLLSVLLISAVVVLPLIFCLGVVLTHKIAGPVKHFEDYLGQIARGEKVGPCRIRKGDELQDLCDSLNEAIARLRSDAEPEGGGPSQEQADLKSRLVAAALPTPETAQDGESEKQADVSPADHSA